MHKMMIAIAGAAMLGACSEQTQQNAEEFAESAAADAAANTEKVLSEGAEVAGNAAEDLDRETAEHQSADMTAPGEGTARENAAHAPAD